MKLLITTVSAALLLASQPAAALNVFACEPEWAALVAELAPEAKTFTATTVYQDPHHIEARPSLIAKLRKADLLICSGASLETGWLPVLLRQAANPGVQPGQPGNLMAAMQVSRIGIPVSLDRSMGDVHAEGNPHVHLDPERLGQIASVTTQRLQKIDPDNSGQYVAAYERFTKRWQQALQRWRQQAQPLQGKNLVIHHNEWAYLNEFLGTISVGTLEPQPGIPPSLGYLAELNASMKNTDVLAIVRKPSDPNKASQWLAQRLNRPAIELPYSVDSHGATNLFELFDQTIALLIAAQAKTQ